MSSNIEQKYQCLVTPREYDNLGKYKINADFVRFYAQDECYRELMVSYYPMLPLLEHTVPFEEADYILYMHMYARCEDYSNFVAKQLENIAKSRKPGAEIIVLGKAANAEKLLNDSISNITFWGDHFTEKLGKKFDMDIKEQYFVYDDTEKHLAIWPVDGCLNKCKFCRRSYMEIKFESLSLETIRTNLDLIRVNTPELMKKISIRAENLTEYGIDIYGKPMLHELIYLINSYDEVEEIEFPIGMCIGEITPQILDALCYSKKITTLYMNLETGSDRLLKFIGKKHTCEQAREVFRKIHIANPNIKILTTIMLGLPTENIGDILDTAKLIIDTRPNHILCNYFICSPNSPLANYPQISNSRREYHLKMLIDFLIKSHVQDPYEFTMTSYLIDKKPLSRKRIREMEKLNRDNKFFEQQGLLPKHFSMDIRVKLE